MGRRQARSDPDLDLPVTRLAHELAGRLGPADFEAVCVDLLAGAERTAYLDVLPWLTGFSFTAGADVLDPTRWKDYWVRTWGARGLLHVWAGSEQAGSAVVVGLGDPHWRPAEMCLKVVTIHQVAGAADAAALLVHHELPRVRAEALRALGVLGDTEHLDVVRAAVEDPVARVSAAASRSWERLGARLDLTGLQADLNRSLGWSPGWSLA